MYEQEQLFFEFVALRPLCRVEDWAETLTCPVIRVDGEKDWRENVVDIALQWERRREGLS